MISRLVDVSRGPRMPPLQCGSHAWGYRWA